METGTEMHSEGSKGTKKIECRDDGVSKAQDCSRNPRTAKHSGPPTEVSPR